jgi:tetratricopeptide (TPR) repeat protein
MPEDEHVLFALVKLYQAKQSQEKAGATFAKLQQAHPGSVFVHILMGEAYDLQEKVDEAISEYLKALELAPDMPRLHFDLGFLYWEAGRMQEAEVKFHEELAINPAFAPPLYYLGDVALDENDSAAAAKFFAGAIAANPGCLDAYIGLSKAYIRDNRISDAARELEKVNRMNDRQPDVHYLLATTYRRLGQSGRSLEEMRRFQSLTNEAKAIAGAPRNQRWVSSTCIDHSQARREVLP